MRRKLTTRATSWASLVTPTIAAACCWFTASAPTRATSEAMPINVQEIFVLIFKLGRLVYAFFSSSNSRTLRARVAGV